MRYFVTAENNRWADDDCLYELLSKANLIHYTNTDQFLYTEAFEHFIDDDVNGCFRGTLGDFVRHAEREWFKPEKEIEAVIYAYDDELWKLHEVCPITGAPKWEWLGEGEKPEKPYRRKYKVKIREDGKPTELDD